MDIFPCYPCWWVLPDVGQPLSLVVAVRLNTVVLSMSIFRFLFFAIAILLAAAGIYSLLPDKPLPDAFTRQVQQQPNPFRVTNDSIAVVKERILRFLQEPRYLLDRERIQSGDSVWQIPYYNSHEKGDRILIEMHRTGDSSRFYCYRWFSKQADEEGGREMALFLQKGIGRYDSK